ncbi:hypothetical protein KY342_00070 [Candidatus Woesearchaeota archaeon]|nr:hypothetical protein [Candidatus Woesearchaeota archaeon]
MGEELLKDYTSDGIKVTLSENFKPVLMEMENILYGITPVGEGLARIWKMGYRTNGTYRPYKNPVVADNETAKTVGDEFLDKILNGEKTPAS